MFSHRDIDPDTDSAFTGALTILQMLAQQSAQAVHYLEILTLLDAAITQQRQRLATQTRQRRSRYVSRIFSLNERSTTPHSPNDDGQTGTTAQLSLQGGPLYPWIPQEEGLATLTPPAMDGTFLDWEGMDLPLWDSFPFTEPGSTVL